MTLAPSTSRTQRWTRIRMVLIAVALLSGFGVVLVRGWDLQVVRAADLKRMADDQSSGSIKLAPRRGTVTDRHGQPLAISVDVDSVWANPRAIQKSGVGVGLAAKRLGQVLEVDAEKLRERLKSSRYFTWVKRSVTPKEAAAVRALKLPGVALETESKRFYPNRTLAAQVLGFVNVDGQGLAGLERSLDGYLQGTPLSVAAVRDRFGRVVPSDTLDSLQGYDGYDVVLTLDESIQHIAERELAAAVDALEAASGTVVVTEPRSGDILALANYPTFNPNRPSGSPDSAQRNRAASDRFEPGSTVKPFTIAGALEEQAITPRTVIYCENGAYSVGEFTIHDTHPWGSLTPDRILAVSSNIGTAKIGAALGRQRLYQALRRFGFGQKTEVPLPGETAGVLRHYKGWYDADVTTISFGQGFSVNIMQLAQAYGALASSGELVQLRLVKRVVDHTGRSIELQPQWRRQAVSPKTAQLVTHMLTGVTEPGGTGTSAAIDGILVAGKTGTAQKSDAVSGGYARDKWLSSFVGFLPANDPRVVIAVAIDEPKVAHLGGQVAAPVFRRVASAVLRQLGILSRIADQPAAQAKAPAVPAPEAPSAREASPHAGELAISLHELSATGGTPRVPDLHGLTLRQAVRRLAASRLTAEVAGSGVVVKQDPSPGTHLRSGRRVRVELRNVPLERSTVSEASL